MCTCNMDAHLGKIKCCLTKVWAQGNNGRVDADILKPLEYLGSKSEHKLLISHYTVDAASLRFGLVALKIFKWE